MRLATDEASTNPVEKFLIKPSLEFKVIHYPQMESKYNYAVKSKFRTR